MHLAHHHPHQLTAAAIGATSTSDALPIRQGVGDRLEHIVLGLLLDGQIVIGFDARVRSRHLVLLRSPYPAVGRLLGKLIFMAGFGTKVRVGLHELDAGDGALPLPIRG